MNEELAYSFHLGSDKNKTKLAQKNAKSNPSGTSSYTNNAIQNSTQLSKINNHNLREYDNKIEDIELIYGTNDIVSDVKNLYIVEFKEAQKEYDAKQSRNDRKVKDYFRYISKDKKKDLACEIIIELGDMDFWQDKEMNYKKKMTEVYKQQVYKLMELMPEFKVANAIVHYDETSPHMHIVGVPVLDNFSRGMKKQVCKTKVFTKESLVVLQDKMRVDCIGRFNKLYEQEAILKQKKKGRNRDIKIDEMFDYRKIKKQLKEKEEKLTEANNKTKEIDVTSDEVNSILDNLKPTKLNKNNMVISSEEIEKIKNYANDVKETTKTIRNVNDLNNAIKDFEHSSFKVEKENSSLKYELELKDEEIKKLKEELSLKDKVIVKLQTEKEKLKQELQVFKGFWKRLLTRFQTKILDESFEKIPEEKRNYTIVADDLINSGIFDDNDAEIVKNPRRKVLTNDELVEIQAKKGKKKNDYNLD